MQIFRLYIMDAVAPRASRILTRRINRRSNVSVYSSSLTRIQFSPSYTRLTMNDSYHCLCQWNVRARLPIYAADRCTGTTARSWHFSYFPSPCLPPPLLLPLSKSITKSTLTPMFHVEWNSRLITTRSARFVDLF